MRVYFIYFFYFSFFSFARISFLLLCIHLYFLIVSLSFKRSSVNKLVFSFLTKMNFVPFTILCMLVGVLFIYDVYLLSFFFLKKKIYSLKNLSYLLHMFNNLQEKNWSFT